MEQLKLLRGNTFFTKHEVIAYAYDGSIVENFDLSQCTDLQIIAHKVNANEIITSYNVTDGNYIRIQWYGPFQQVGPYRLEILGRYDGIEWRFFDKQPIFILVDTISEVHIPEDRIINVDYYSLDASNIFLEVPTYIIDAVQSDWEETNDSSFAYIKNKPDLLSASIEDEELIITQ